jgi:predicted ATPase
MPKLDYITIKGFKSIASMEKLELRPINIVIGPNGSGKSNFIGVFAFLNAIRDGKLKDYVAKAGNADKILHFGSKVTPKMELNLSFEEEKNQYSLELEATPKGELYRSGESVYFWGDKQAYPRPYEIAVTGRDNLREAGISDPKASGIAGYVRDDLASWRLYHLHDTGPSSPLKKPAPIEDNEYLRGDGSNLAAFLYFLKEKHPTSYSLIRRTIQRVTPFFDDFRLRPRRLNEATIQLQWSHQNSDAYFDATSLSDGTLRFIALATLLLQPEEYRPSIILIDEPELGLHPFAITMLGQLIKLAATKTQAIVGTQSPLLLDQFTPQDVLVANRVEGTTRLSRLENDKLKSWLEDYSLGQLWEKNEFGGRPSPE